MKNKGRKKGTFLITIGLLLIAAALLLVAYNIWTDRSAGYSSNAALRDINAAVGLGDLPEGDGCWVFVPYGDGSDGSIIDGQTGRWVFIPADRMIAAGVAEDGQWVFLPYANDKDAVQMNDENGRWLYMPVGVVADAAANELQILDPEGQVPQYPDYMLSPDMEMPQIKVDGKQYIGALRIPSLKLNLPVAGQWNYPNLRVAPCRYQGSAYKNDLIICGHNYDRHFGRLKTLRIGAEVDFTDASGNVFRYRVVEMETLKPRAVEQMRSGDWDLTLFTCTIGGRTRVTVRCERI